MVANRSVDLTRRCKSYLVALGSTSANGTVGKRQYDIVAHLRARRPKWLGHILRMPQTEQLRQVVIDSVAASAREKGELSYDQTISQNAERHTKFC